MIDPFGSMTNSLSAQGQRPFNLQSSKSFTRYEPSKPEPRSRNRASSLRNGVVANIPDNDKSAAVLEQPQGGDVFEKRNSEENRRETKAIVASTAAEGLPEGFDELPIELISLTDR